MTDTTTETAKRLFKSPAVRGYDALCYIREKIDEHEAAGSKPSVVYITRDVAGYLVAFYNIASGIQAHMSMASSFPRTVRGVPIRLGPTGGNDFAFGWMDQPRSTH